MDPGDVITPLSVSEERQRKELGGIGPQNYQAGIGRRTMDFFLRRKKKHGNKIFWEHMSANELISVIEHELFNQYFVFCFERNSFEKTYSNYKWKKSKPHNNFRCFSDYILNGNHTHRDWHMYTLNNQIIVDKVFQYANLLDEMRNVCGRLNIPWQPEKFPAAKRISTSYENIEEYFGPKEIKFVESNFCNEISEFGYRL